jgi:hypothetical protein
MLMSDVVIRRNVSPTWRLGSSPTSESWLNLNNYRLIPTQGSHQGSHRHENPH